MFLHVKQDLDLVGLLRVYLHNTHLIADDVPHQDIITWKREMRRINKYARKLLAEQVK